MENFKELDQELESILKELLEIKDFNTKNIIRNGYAIKYLVDEKYVDGNDLKIDGSSEPAYVITGIEQKGKEYFESKNKHKKKKRNDLIWKFVVPIITHLVGLIAGYFLNRFFK